MCLAHGSEEQIAAALKLIGETGEIDVRGVPITPSLLERVLAAAPRGEAGHPLIKRCNFSKATFSGDAKFTGATFSGNAEFGEATFSGDAKFTGATFSDYAVFYKAAFSGEARFGATFGGYAMFNRATFSGDTRFNGATFGEYAGFNGASFSGVVFDRASFSNAEFIEAAFSGLAMFSSAAFSGYATFRGAAFSGYAEFGEATFGDAEFGEATFGDAEFGEATFGGNAKFGEATFSGNAKFGEATFSGDAEFGGATFGGNTSFDRAIFKRRAGFDRATFKRHAGFAGARFELSRQFGPILAYRGLVLDNVQFAQPVEIEVSSIGLCCRRSRFPGGVQFRLRWARVVLDDTDLAAPSILSGIPRLSTEGLARQEEQIAKAWQRLLADKISERPQLLSLRRANVAGLGLSNVSAADCRFAGAHNLDKLRLESDVSFATAPLLLSSGGGRWGGREVIAEERAWRADRPRSHRWTAPSWPDWLDDQRPGVLEPGQIAGLYRALRKGREDTKDEPGAADFYYGEMEMRRRARRTHGGPTDSQARAESRGRVERGILTTYWLVSGYGLRAWRAVACLAVVTALLGLAFHFVGFAVPPHPVSYWTSLLYAFRATLSLTDNQVQLTAWGGLLQGVLRLTGPVLLGLALLALRGRVKR
jgi:uncharacterized protein YjbI with pentapeptide repeats